MFRNYILISRFLKSSTRNVFRKTQEQNFSSLRQKSRAVEQRQAAEKFDQQQAKRVKKIGFFFGFLVGAVPTSFLIWYLIKKLRNKRGESNKLSLTVAECQVRVFLFPSFLISAPNRGTRRM